MYHIYHITIVILIPIGTNKYLSVTIESKITNVSDNMQSRKQLIWLSCIDKPRTLKDISEEWKYANPTALYKGNLASKMKESKLLDIQKVGSGSIFYLGGFEGWFNKASFNGNEKFILKDKKEWLKFLDSQFARKTFFTIELVKTFFKGDIDKIKLHGFELPKVVLGFSVMFLVLEENGININENKEFVKDFLIPMQEDLIFDYANYLKNIKLDTEELKKHDYILNTVYGKLKTSKITPFLKKVLGMIKQK